MENAHELERLRHLRTANCSRERSGYARIEGEKTRDVTICDRVGMRVAIENRKKP